jgi:hypothetical protein
MLGCRDCLDISISPYQSSPPSKLGNQLDGLQERFEAEATGFPRRSCFLSRGVPMVLEGGDQGEREGQAAVNSTNILVNPELRRFTSTPTPGPMPVPTRAARLGATVGFGIVEFPVARTRDSGSV